MKIELRHLKQIFRVPALALAMMGMAAATVQSATYPGMPYKGPSPMPEFPLEFTDFTPPVHGESLDANAPAIAEWTRHNQPGDTMALTGERLSMYSNEAEGRDTQFIIYGGDTVVKGLIQRLDGRQCALTIPDTLPSDRMYFLWPGNNAGYGRPVAVNRAEAWWIGPGRITRNGLFSVYGCNLQLGGGKSYLYIEELDLWLDSVSANPFKADFVLPEEVGNGSYTVWAHNGHGGPHGWAVPLKVSVESAVTWSGTVFDVTEYGATGDGVTDDSAAINSALQAADGVSGSTVFFPAGHYRLSTKIRQVGLNRVRLVGEHMDTVTIEPNSAYGSSGWPGFLIQQKMTDVEVRNLTLKANAYGAETVVRLESGSDNVSFSNVRFSQYETGGTGSKIVYLQSCNDIRFTGCEFIASANMLASDSSQIHVEGSTFIGCYDANTLFGMSDSTCISVLTSLARNYDEQSSEEISAGWAKGRFIHATGGIRYVYIGESATSNMCPRVGTSDQNVGEAVMFEFCSSLFRDRVVSASSTTATFATAPAVSLKGLIAVIVDGQGLGQSREVADVVGNSISVTEPWEVSPGADSIIMIGKYSRRNVVYNNFFDGRSRGVNSPTHIASAGVEPYGGCVSLIVAKNVFHELRAGISNWSLDTPLGTGKVIQPNYFNLFVDNVMTNCRWAYKSYADGTANADMIFDVSLLGNVLRNSRISDIAGSAVFYKTFLDDNTIGLGIYDRNLATNIAASIEDDAGLENQVWINNRFSGVGSGTGVPLSTGHIPALRGNQWTGFASTYGGDLPGGVLEIPIRFIEAEAGTPVNVPILNSGTDALNWTATSDSSWLSVTKAGGEISDENSEGFLVLEVDPLTAPQEGTEAIVSVDGEGGDTKQITVEYTTEPVIPPPPDPPPAPVLTGIAVSGPATVTEGGTAQFVCTAGYSDGSTQQVDPTWSEDAASADIDPTGLLSAGDVTADETATITAVYGSYTDSHEVTIQYVPPVLTGIAINGPSSVDEEQSEQYTCTAFYSDGSSAGVTPAWTVDSAYATMDASGVLSAGNVASDQQAVITAGYGGATDTHAVTISYVAPTLTGIAISGPAQVNEGQTAQFTCTASYSDGTSETVTPSWNENSMYTDISASGLLSAGNVAADQTVTVGASFEGRTDTWSVTVLYVPPVLTGIEITGAASLNEETSSPYTCTAFYSDGTTAAVSPTWNVESAYAAISSSGRLTAGDVSSDQSVVVGATYGGQTDTHAVTILYVPPVVTGIAISGLTQVDEGQSIQLTCTASYSDGTTGPVTPQWNLNSAYASISGSGLLSAGDVSTDQAVTITATYEGQSDTHAVSIAYVAPVLSGIEISGPAGLNEETTAEYTCTAMYSDGTSEVVTPDWNEDSPYAAISGSGQLSAGNVAADEYVTITAGYEGMSDSYPVVIAYVPPTLTGIVITGPASVGENSTGQYDCTATYSDGTTASIDPVWDTDSASASINSSGLLTAGNVAADEQVTLYAGFSGQNAALTVWITAIGDQVVFDLSGFEGKTVSAELWDDVQQTSIDLGEDYEPEQIVIENVNPQQWYWLGLREYDPATGEWVLVHGRWIWM